MTKFWMPEKAAPRWTGGIIFSLYYSGAVITKIKATVQIQQKVKRINVQFSGGVVFDKNGSTVDSSIVSSDEEKY